MSNIDKSSSATTRRLKNQTLAVFRARNPDTKSMINAESVRIAQASQACLDCLQTCGELGVFETINMDLNNWVSDGPYIYNGVSYSSKYPVTWTAVPNATSYTFTFDTPGQNAAEITGPTSAMVYTNDASAFSITALNDCEDTTVSEKTQPCFLAGSLVTLAGGTTKAIEDVHVGDIVLGAFGEENVVLALHRPLLGDAHMCKINGEHSTTAHHPHVSVDKKFYCCDPATVSENTYGRTHKVYDAFGEYVDRYLHGLNKERIHQLVEGIVLKTVDGSRVVSTLELYNLPPDTQLYNLAVSGSHTYHVDGYAVTGWPREDDFDYDSWAPRH